jgi:hypothetical protein
MFKTSMARCGTSGQIWIFNDSSTSYLSVLAQNKKINTWQENGRQNSFENATFFSISHPGAAISWTLGQDLISNDGHSYYPPHAAQKLRDT